MVKFFFVGLHLLRCQGAKILLPQSTDKEGSKDAAVAAFHTSVEWQPQQQAFLVADNSDLIFERVNCLNQAANGILHFMQPVDAFFIGRQTGFNN